MYLNKSSLHRFRACLSCLAILPATALVWSCKDADKGARIETPWGEVVSDTASTGTICSLSDIISNGEIIAATLSGPDTYFEYRGRDLGTQYMVCAEFARQLGVSLRVEVCRDTTELVDKVSRGEADIIMCMLPENIRGAAELKFCGAKSDGRQWAVAKGNDEMAKALDDWYKPEILADVKKKERYMLSSVSVRRHVYAPFLSREKGVISQYDNLFRRYAPVARWDWRLLAAQCYQESCFDPNARSWAGACGLMQIMPSTADHLGLARSDMANPEKSVEAAVRLLAELQSHFRDIPSAEERRCFVLAAYNGGAFHIRDAMALTRKYGGDCHRWRDVAPYVLKLQNPEFYSDPVVAHGYMRGSETVGYVDKIRQRYAQYRGCKYTGASVDGNGHEDGGGWNAATPRRATKKYKYHI